MKIKELLNIDKILKNKVKISYNHSYDKIMKTKHSTIFNILKDKLNGQFNYDEVVFTIKDLTFSKGRFTSQISVKPIEE